MMHECALCIVNSDVHNDATWDSRCYQQKQKQYGIILLLHIITAS